MMHHRPRSDAEMLTETGAKDAGLGRTRGKDYIVQEGDAMPFRINTRTLPRRVSV